jgi:ketosteroid isomerase-like protein
MSQEDKNELARRWRDAFNAFMRGESSAEIYAEQFDPQIEVRWHDRRTYPDAPQQVRGLAEVIAFTEQYRSTWDHLALEVLEFVEAPDDQILVFVRQTGQGRESGVPIVLHFFELLTIRDGKLAKMEFFRHRANALEAAGLRE